MLVEVISFVFDFICVLVVKLMKLIEICEVNYIEFVCLCNIVEDIFFMVNEF